jgi:hypothetical protein
MEENLEGWSFLPRRLLATIVALKSLRGSQNDALMHYHNVLEAITAENQALRAGRDKLEHLIERAEEECREQNMGEGVVFVSEIRAALDSGGNEA